MKLFESAENSTTCKTCKFRERWECGGKVMQYCGVRQSGRTENGLLKISTKNPSCYLYQIESEK